MRTTCVCGCMCCVGVCMRMCVHVCVCGCVRARAVRGYVRMLAGCKRDVHVVCDVCASAKFNVHVLCRCLNAYVCDVTNEHMLCVSASVCVCTCCVCH